MTDGLDTTSPEAFIIRVALGAEKLYPCKNSFNASLAPAINEV